MAESIAHPSLRRTCGLPSVHVVLCCKNEKCPGQGRPVQGRDRSGLVHRPARPPGAVGAQLPQVFVASGERPRQCSVERLTVYAASLPCRGHGLNIRRLRPGRAETAELMSLGFHIIQGREMGGVAKTVGEHGPSGVEPVDAGRRIGGEHDTPRCCLEGDARNWNHGGVEGRRSIPKSRGLSRHSPEPPSLLP